METITLYVDWNNKKVITAKAIEKEVKKQIEEATTDSVKFEAFLEDHYGMNEIFTMSKKEKEEIVKEFKMMQTTNTTNRVFSRYHKIVIDTVINTITIYE